MFETFIQDRMQLGNKIPKIDCRSKTVLQNMIDAFHRVYKNTEAFVGTSGPLLVRDDGRNHFLMIIKPSKYGFLIPLSLIFEVSLKVDVIVSNFVLREVKWHSGAPRLQRREHGLKPRFIWVQS